MKKAKNSEIIATQIFPYIEMNLANILQSK